MITSVEDLDKMLARMIVAKHPERLEELSIDTEYIASLLRPTIEFSDGMRWRKLISIMNFCV